MAHVHVENISFLSVKKSLTRFLPVAAKFPIIALNSSSVSAEVIDKTITDIGCLQSKVLEITLKSSEIV